MEFFKLLIGTVTLRPYVFVFFACYLFLAITSIGRKRTLAFSVIAFVIAFISEWSSAVALTGFPFGLYHYIATTQDRELWIAGVPFMDSLSFTFLSYVSWEMAVTFLSRLKVSWRDVQADASQEFRHSWPVTLLASFLMMYLDIVIDPVALQGDRWFLGKIYYYPSGGSYFGITLANFLGWFFVCAAILRVFALFDRFLKPSNANGRLAYRFKALAPAGLYFGILGFNLFMTFWIGERQLGVVGSIIILPLIVFLLVKLHREGVVSTV